MFPIQKLMQIIDGQNQQNTIFGILRMIRFDTDPDQDKLPFERYIYISNNVEDAKGNPGSIGIMFLTNLRFIWQLKTDTYINLVVGLDCILNVQIKTTPIQYGSGLKHLMIIKAQNPQQTRYQFKFVGYKNEQLKIFEKIADMRKQLMETKSYRSTNLSIKFENQYEAMSKQQVKGVYNNLILYQDGRKMGCKVFLTNVRIVIIKEGEKKMNYGIVWITVRNVEMIEEGDLRRLRLYLRGILSEKMIFLTSAKPQQLNKLESELKSFAEIYNKSPNLGYTWEEQIKGSSIIKKQVKQYEELQHTNINLVRRKNAYTSSTNDGQLQETQFNADIGLMMERLPEGVKREDLWEILQ